MDTNFKFFKGNENNNSIIWRTAKGRHIPIEWMSTQHITNCLSCLIIDGENEIPNPYFGKTHSEWIGIFEAELNNRQ
jgi:hypothetical protein